MVRTVSAQEAFDEMKKNTIAKFIDVRSPDEYGFKHAKNSVNVPLSVLDRVYQSYNLKEGTENIPFYVICRSGRMSLQACEILTKAGYKDVSNIDGGIMNWVKSDLPVVGG